MGFLQKKFQVPFFGDRLIVSPEMWGAGHQLPGDVCSGGHQGDAGSNRHLAVCQTCKHAAASQGASFRICRSWQVKQSERPSVRVKGRPQLFRWIFCRRAFHLVGLDTSSPTSPQRWNWLRCNSMKTFLVYAAHDVWNHWHLAWGLLFVLCVYCSHYIIYSITTITLAMSAW